MKKIIINADDYGLCNSVSKGIIDCYTKGLVSDFSFLVNPDCFSQSIELLAKHNIDSCGIHFNLSLGRTAFQPRKNISDKHGNYNSVKKHLINYLTGNLCVDDIYEEFKMQLQLLQKEDFRITHFDTHQNIHILPPVYAALKKLSAESGEIPIRIPKEKIDLSYQYQFSNLKRILVFNFFSLLIRNQAKYGTSVRTIGGDFYNNMYPSKVIKNIVKQISKSSYHVFELAVHPGYFSMEILQYDPYALQRETELRLLIDPNNLFEINNIQISSFGSL